VIGEKPRKISGLLQKNQFRTWRGGGGRKGPCNTRVYKRGTRSKDIGGKNSVGRWLTLLKGKRGLGGGTRDIDLERQLN